MNAQFASNWSAEMFVRFDHYRSFNYVLGTRPSTDRVTLSGISPGLLIQYHAKWNHHLSFIGGLGYYRNSVTKIVKYNSQFGTAHLRDIEFPTAAFIELYTDKYKYHCISPDLGIECSFIRLKGNTWNCGLHIMNDFSIRQHYHLPGYPGKTAINTNDVKYFSTHLQATIGYLFRLQRSMFEPQVVVPIFDIWKQDAVFPGESNFKTRNKWFNAIGLSIKYYLPKHKP